MDATLVTTEASRESFPWLSLIVLLPALGALILQFIPQQEKDKSFYRNFSIGILAVDFLLIICDIVWLFSLSINSLIVVFILKLGCKY